MSAFVAAPASAATEKRFALVIGNAKYPAIPLTNPENDAKLVSATLRKLGFDVSEQLNLKVREFRRVLREFARRVQEEDGVAVLYYAGHGVQIDGRNYLLPVDINLRDEEEVKDESVDVDDLFMSRIERARAQVRVVILDACRDNPFRGKTRNIRAAGGLAEMAARGALIAYSSAPGAAAEDGPAGANSVYTRHLAEEMLVEGIEVEQMFKNVRVKVLRDTRDRQIPWVNTSLTVNFSFNPTRGIRTEAAKTDRDQEIQALMQKMEEDRRRLEAELEQTRAELERSKGGSVTETERVDRDRIRLELELERMRREVARAKASSSAKDDAPRVVPIDPRRPIPVEALGVPKPGPTAIARPDPVIVVPRTDMTKGDAPPGGNAGAQLERCSNLLMRLTLGEPVRAQYDRECR